MHVQSDLIQKIIQELPPQSAWQKIYQEYLSKDQPFSSHHQLFQQIFKSWDKTQGPPPAWMPEQRQISSSNIFHLMSDMGMQDYSELFSWAAKNRNKFWERMVRRLDVHFKRDYDRMRDPSSGLEAPAWLPGARLNIIESCFQADPDAAAVIYQPEGQPIQKMTYAELNRLSNRVANGLQQAGFKPGDRIAIAMLMNVEAVAAYLGIIKAGCVAVSIADSFAPEEIATRLRIADVSAIFTQDILIRAGKELPMYQKIVSIHGPRAIVLPAAKQLSVNLRPGDLLWDGFLDNDDQFQALMANPGDDINILFSSGTTGDPKAIPWTHSTPIKCASDAFLHHDIHAGDVMAWPTNLGWMMGPWLIFASLINKASMALYYGAPTNQAFGEFVQDAKVTMLGLVPSIVKAWRASGCMQDLDWSAIKAFSSTGECSNAEDYLYLMYLANYKPVIEYCGGTEIGGGYMSGTLVQPASPATFSTPCLGLDIVIVDDEGKPSDQGELFIIPPSIGLSNRLINRDHHEVYFSDTPQGLNGELLRRHGDYIEHLGNGYYRGHGRADDTMNLGGIKTSSADIERVCTIHNVHECAAIAVAPSGGGPSQLVIYAVSANNEDDSAKLLTSMQAAIKSQLNPLFKIHAVVMVNALPRTASNKVMRRVLRAQYLESQSP